MASISIFLGVPLLLMQVILHHTKSPIAAYWGNSASFQMFDCQSLRFLCILRCSIASHMGDSTSSKVFYCCSEVCLSVISGVPLMLTNVIHFHSMLLSATHSGNSVSFQVLYHYYFGTCVSLQVYH